DEVCDLSIPSVFDLEPDNREVKSLYESPKTNDSFSTVDVKLFPKSDVKDPSLTNDFSSCSFMENVKSTRNLCNKSGIADRIHCKNNFVRSKKCFVCGSKSYLIKDCHVYDTVDNFPSVVLEAAPFPAGSRNSSASTSAGRSILAASRNISASIHAGRSIFTSSRNRLASIHAGRSIPAASSNRPASIHAGRHILVGRSNKPTPFPAGRVVPTGWTNHAARPFFRPTNLYFDTVSWPGIYDHISMTEGRWGSDVKSSVNPHMNKDISIVDSGCSRSMTGNKEKLDDFVVSITNPHNKTPYELLSRKVPNIRHLKPFGCQVTILNTSDHLGKFEGKANDGFLVGYAAHSKAYRVYNLSSKKIEETLNLRYLEDKPNVQGLGQEWYFDLDYLTDSLGYTRFKTNLPAALLHQAAIESCRNLVLTAGDRAGSIVSIGGVPAGSVTASRVPAGSLPASSVSACSVPASHVPASSISAGGVFAGSIDSAEFGDPAASDFVPAVVSTDSAATSLLPPAAKSKLKDESDPPVNVHLYQSMIGSLMYLTASRPGIMFAVSACSRHHVTPLTSHLNAVKKIF
nr:retrovirus-related Pol polyprotein from transposon TNT 1-94 [Tanacetum cinerariifolium]